MTIDRQAPLAGVLTVAVAGALLTAPLAGAAGAQENAADPIQVQATISSDATRGEITWPQAAAPGARRTVVVALRRSGAPDVVLAREVVNGRQAVSSFDIGYSSEDFRRLAGPDDSVVVAVSQGDGREADGSFRTYVADTTDYVRVGAQWRPAATTHADGDERRDCSRVVMGPGADLTDCQYRFADLLGVNLRGATLDFADFSYTRLSLADLSATSNRSTDYRVAHLIGTDLTDARELGTANFSGADLGGAAWSDGRTCARFTSLSRCAPDGGDAADRRGAPAVSDFDLRPDDGNTVVTARVRWPGQDPGLLTPGDTIERSVRVLATRSRDSGKARRVVAQAEVECRWNGGERRPPACAGRLERLVQVRLDAAADELKPIEVMVVYSQTATTGGQNTGTVATTTTKRPGVSVGVWRDQRWQSIDVTDGADLSRVNFASMDLDDESMRFADLRQADVSAVWLRRSDLTGVKATGANFAYAFMSDAVVAAADLAAASFFSADLQRADVRDSNLRRADLISADLRSADLRGSDFRDADLHRARIDGAQLAGADFSGATWVDGIPCADGSIGKCVPEPVVAVESLRQRGDALVGDLAWTGVGDVRRVTAAVVGPRRSGLVGKRRPFDEGRFRIPLPEGRRVAVSFTATVPARQSAPVAAPAPAIAVTTLAVDRRNGEFAVGEPAYHEVTAGADLRGADLRGAELSGADLSNADLTGATLDSARLVRANLRAANARQASFVMTNLTEADLLGATIDGARFAGARLTGARWVDGRTCPAGTKLIGNPCQR